MTRAYVTVRAAAKRLGYEDVTNPRDCQSGLSESQYLELFGPLAHDEPRVKIRFSDHDARPTYQLLRGEADFEVGNHQDADGDTTACIEWLARQVGKPVPPPVHRAVNPSSLRERIRRVLRALPEYIPCETEIRPGFRGRTRPVALTLTLSTSERVAVIMAEPWSAIGPREIPSSWQHQFYTRRGCGFF